jgi:hypothetical protein
MFMALPEGSAMLRCGFQRVRFTDDGCFTVEVDHDSKFPRARTAHARGFGFQFFEVRIRRTPHSFIVLAVEVGPLRQN